MSVKLLGQWVYNYSNTPHHHQHTHTSHTHSNPALSLAKRIGLFLQIPQACYVCLVLCMKGCSDKSVWLKVGNGWLGESVFMCWLSHSSGACSDELWLGKLAVREALSLRRCYWLSMIWDDSERARERANERTVYQRFLQRSYASWAKKRWIIQEQCRGALEIICASRWFIHCG